LKSKEVGKGMRRKRGCGGRKAVAWMPGSPDSPWALGCPPGCRELVMIAFRLPGPLPRVGQPAAHTDLCRAISPPLLAVTAVWLPPLPTGAVPLEHCWGTPCTNPYLCFQRTSPKTGKKQGFQCF
jgi:hypothetical protein